MSLSYQSYRLKFKLPGGTSRGVLTEKETFLIRLKLEDEKETEFFGEIGLFRGLSFDDQPQFEAKLQSICSQFDLENKNWWEDLREFPSIQFGLEQIHKAKEIYAGRKPEDEFNPILFPSDFTDGISGIPINGLIWMGGPDFMKKQIREKLDQNFHCLKLKIGVNWEEEFQILQNLRNEYAQNELEIRVDANGAFDFQQAKIVLNQLADLKIHSIEQPIKTGQIQEMAELCETTPTPIALDEELIGVIQLEDKRNLLQTIQPQFIILKPSLVGGWKGSQEWIDLAENQKIDWWITSALESNIGLNAIAQWTFTLNNPMPQGLGTGGLFENNFYSRLKVRDTSLFFI